MGPRFHRTTGQTSTEGGPAFRPNRRARLPLALAFAAIAAVAFSGIASARGAQPVRIVSHMVFPGDAPNYGDFTVEGGGGLMCASGDVQDTDYLFSGYQSGFKVQILVLKDFICDDGVIRIKIQVHSVADVGETFTWVVLGGTGAYAHVAGAGQGETIPNADPSTGNTNIYTGILAG